MCVRTEVVLFYFIYLLVQNYSLYVYMVAAILDLDLATRFAVVAFPTPTVTHQNEIWNLTNFSITQLRRWMDRGYFQAPVHCVEAGQEPCDVNLTAVNMFIKHCWHDPVTFELRVVLRGQQRNVLSLLRLVISSLIQSD